MPEEKICHSCKNIRAGKDLLMHRFTDIILRKPEKLSSICAILMNPEVVSSYFRALQDTITKNELASHPERVWNGDETRFHFEHSPENVVVEKRDRCMLLWTSAKSNNVTVMACVNAIGHTMPPMVIKKGKMTQWLQGYNVGEAPPDCLWLDRRSNKERWFDEVL